jgi:rfaE bifunctional protein kinase chain/domain
MPRIGPNTLLAWRAKLPGRRVAVVGEPVLDEYVYGTTLRISREAPVPIVREDGRERRLGGAANAAANLAALGVETTLIGLIGDDASADALCELARGRGIEIGGLVRATGRATVTKTRVLAGGLHTTKQQLLRLDRENDSAPPAAVLDQVVEAALAAARGADAVVISDYGDPGLSDALVEVAARLSAAGQPVIVDSRYALQRFRGVLAVTPNEPEVEAALGVRLSSPADAVHAAGRLVDELGIGAALLTRGREGMAIARRGEPTWLLAAHGAPEALDVTGAGDTVTATFAAALAAGAPVLEAAAIANCAASVVVQAIGCATVDPDTLDDELDAFAPGSLREAEPESRP